MKKKLATKVMESDSMKILKGILPHEWEIREYHPDYGVDCVVEIFDTDPAGENFITAGEHAFVQLKSQETLDRAEVTEFDRKNVEKFPENALSKGKVKIPVVKFVIDLDELDLALNMSAALPLILVLVELVSGKAYFLNLTDYQEKIGFKVAEDNPNQGSLTIYIPETNILSAEVVRYYSRRPKLLSFFNKVHFLANEIFRCDRDELVVYSRAFISRLQTINWEGFVDHESFRKMLARIEELNGQYEQFVNDGRESYYLEKIDEAWRNIQKFGLVFEDIHREGFLPTALGRSISM
jgi:hypothetical protein